MAIKETKPEETAQANTSFAGKLQSTADKEAEQGFRGVEVDPTPNENYTVKGVTSGAPTPETNVKSAEEARGATGLGLSALEWQEQEKKRGNKQ